MLSAIVDLLSRVLMDVWGAMSHNWPYLLVSVLVAAAMSVYVGTDRLADWLRRNRWTAITGAVLLATLTPFCSCGTTAMVLGMLVTRTPWAPVVAFMVASPLTSPSELALSVGLFGWPFALTYFLGATGLGFAAGGVAGWMEDRGLLAGQARMRTATGCGTAPAPAALVADGGTGASPAASTVATCERPAPVRQASSGRVVKRLRLPALSAELWRMGRRLLLYFLAYTALAFLVLELLPGNSLVHLLGDNAIWNVPVAALLGIPVYITSEGSLPMVAALMSGGLGAGAAMAFLITGAGTSVPAISGMLVIARRRVVGLVVALLFSGALLLGWLAAITLQ
jgi:uncharacterized membrane protein YraQ (UPF0718 family)